MKDAIDPANTSTPVQDAVDALNNASTDGYGTVLYPPRVENNPIMTPGGIRGYSHQNHIGWGWSSSFIKKEANSNPLLDAGAKPDSRECYWDGLTFEGPGLGSATEPFLLVNEGSDIPFHDFGHVQIWRFNSSDGVIKMVDNGFFACRWEALRTHNNGPFISNSASTSFHGGPSNWIGQLSGYGGQNGSDFIYLDQGPRWRIENLNLGGDYDRAMYVNNANHRWFSVGQLNFEITDSTNVSTIIKKESSGQFIIERIGNYADVDQAVELGVNNGSARIGEITGGTYANAKINVTGAPDDTTNAPSYYFGSSNDVVNNSGTAGAVRCLASAGTSV